MPPQEEVYQRITSPVPPPPPFKVSVVLWPLQIVDWEAVAETGSAETVFTVIVTDAHAEFTEHGAPVSYLP